MAIIVMNAVYFKLLPAFSWLMVHNHESTVLREALFMKSASNSSDALKGFIPAGYLINDTLTDVMITAWDLNNRSPRFFSKKMYGKYDNSFENNTFNHQLSFADMIWASASTPLFFKPAVIDNTVYISGDNFAVSPAMYAYFYAAEQLGKNTSDIRLISIGAVNTLAEKIDSKASLLDWAERLATLSAPVKKHTMDYMAAHFLAQGGGEMQKYELDKDNSWSLDLYFNTEQRTSDIQDAADEFL